MQEIKIEDNTINIIMLKDGVMYGGKIKINESKDLMRDFHELFYLSKLEIEKL